MVSLSLSRFLDIVIFFTLGSFKGTCNTLTDGFVVSIVSPKPVDRLDS